MPKSKVVRFGVAARQPRRVAKNTRRVGRSYGLPPEAPAAGFQARESSDNPRLNAFCRVAPSVRLRDLAIFLAGVFFRASDLSSRTCTDVHSRLFDAFFAMHDLRA